MAHTVSGPTALRNVSRLRSEREGSAGTAPVTTRRPRTTAGACAIDSFDDMQPGVRAVGCIIVSVLTRRLWHGSASVGHGAHLRRAASSLKPSSSAMNDSPISSSQ